MESFSVNAIIENREVTILIIPDDSIDTSIFHLVANGEEISKIRYTDSENWKVIDGQTFSEPDLKEICSKIEEHFF
ncbi:hypothetical protein [Desertivirga xinjiangensis]|uniref:hypothetical protein n=1 Tax=Desertivirga xinjiangensis TaxID=539206 RepID=UPI00210A3DA2|nr:hypothetical protein [Pedobacter xinjiangensis]